MNQIIPASFGAVSNKFASTPVADDLSSGIQSSFGLIGYKGKVWSVRYRGDETPLMREDGDGPRNSIEVVILQAAKTVSKIWYKDGYVEGSNAAPDCFSNNGVVPEVSSKLKQCETCAACPMNQWGSRITPAGKQGKACSDSKRLAVVPEQDMLNEAHGGPMLLRVPAASLQDIAMYGQKMQQMGFPYYAVVTKISFDPNEAFPKFIFTGVRPLNDAEADVVLAHREGHQVERILSESEFAVAQAAQGENVTPGATTAVSQGPAGVGEQARAAAAQVAANNAKQQAAAAKPVEQPKQEAPKPDLSAKLAGLLAAGFDEAEAKSMLGIVDPEPTPEPEPIDPKVQALMDAMGMGQQEAEAMIAAKAATPEPKPIDPKVQAVMDATGLSQAEAETMVAARQANAARAQTTEQPATKTVAPVKEPEPMAQQIEATPVTTAGNSDQGTIVEASAFEADLDDMLSNLLPK